MEEGQERRRVKNGRLVKGGGKKKGEEGEEGGGRRGEEGEEEGR